MSDNAGLPELTIAEAAVALGKSPGTIRAMRKRGELQGKLVDGKFGREWRILLDRPYQASIVEQEGSVSAAVNPDERLKDLVALADRLSREAERLSRENVELAARLGYVQAQLDAKQIAPPKKKGWWRRWLPGLK